jgi:tryptophanase
MKYLIIQYIAVIIITLLANSFIYPSISMKEHKKLMKDYQVLLHMDTVWIYDNGKFVGKFTKDSADWDNKYDSIFIRDNL